jgi:aspartate-semialdehyde dehydrogenase
VPSLSTRLHHRHESEELNPIYSSDVTRPPRVATIAFQRVSHNTALGPEGYNGEATKVMMETRKILAEPERAITATCVRVPVLRAHTESINLTLKQPLSPERARTLLADYSPVA